MNALALHAKSGSSAVGMSADSYEFNSKRPTDPAGARP